MRAVIVSTPGGPEVLKIAEWASPSLGAGEVRIRARATSLNGADLLQRRGMYPPPMGESPLLGLEVAGEILEVAADVKEFTPGDRVMALLSGGGYAEEVVVPAGQVMPIPRGLDFEQSAAIPEVFVTAFLELVILGELKRGEHVLVHSAGGGVGTAALQLAHELGAIVLATASSRSKLERCRELGAAHLIDYKTEDFAAKTKEITGGKGVELVLDLVGAAHWQRNVEALSIGGRLLLVGLSGGAKPEVDLRPILAKRLKIIGSTLRSRSREEKAEIVRRFAGWAIPLFEAGRLRPVLDRVFLLEQVAEAHRYLETHQNFGKVVLRI